jgi:hypothetical protein
MACTSHQNLAMPKSKIDKAREERIRNEIIVDCYNESERFSAWYSAHRLVSGGKRNIRVRHDLPCESIQMGHDRFR